MENLSHADSKNTGSKPFLIFKTDTIPQSVFESHHFSFTSKKYLADIQIEEDRGNYCIKSKSNNFDSPHILSRENLAYFLRSLSSSIEESTQTVIKPISMRAPADKLTSEQHLLIKELSTLFLTVKSISTFSQRLLGHSVFKEFKSIHLFIHEKGSAHSIHKHITRNTIEETRESIAEFSTLFQAVRKSKNRSFGQSTLKASNYKIIGTCIAQEFSLLNHNLVFLYSNDDFLPQSGKDIENFQSIKSVLKILFEIHLNSEFNLEKVEIIKNTISTLLRYSGEDEGLIYNFEELTEDNYVNFDSIIESLKEKFFDHADINLVERIALLGELLNTLQHELSNPLFGLQLSSEILLGEELDEEQKLFVKNINLSIKRSQNILGNFAGLYKKNVKMEENNLLEIINEVSTLTKSESRNIKKLITHESDDKAEYTTITNPTWLAQIVFNLIINSTQALKESSHSSPQIDIHVRKALDGFYLSFKDNGPGIPENKVQHIFDPFYTTKDDGNGLGLAISRKLALKLGGDLKYEGNTDGASFLLRLPLL